MNHRPVIIATKLERAVQRGLWRHREAQIRAELGQIVRLIAATGLLYVVLFCLLAVTHAGLGDYLTVSGLASTLLLAQGVTAWRLLRRRLLRSLARTIRRASRAPRPLAAGWSHIYICRLAALPARPTSIYIPPRTAPTVWPSRLP